MLELTVDVQLLDTLLISGLLLDIRDEERQTDQKPECRMGCCKAGDDALTTRLVGDKILDGT